ncbi:MAG TPA: hypothetical protein ENJ08_08825 [Gammaproteobacteria bacterium]|nr:hypothetical protein [Gammaproteobacteria bacterium]
MTCSAHESDKPALKVPFLTAVHRGELGTIFDGLGVVITLKAFRAFFSDIRSDYVSSFLPTATLEPSQLQMTPMKFIFRLRPGVYLVHPDVLKSLK